MGFRTHRIAAGLFIASGGFIVLSSLVAVAGMGSTGPGLVFAWLGGALFQTFHGAALYAPSYLFSLGFFAWRQKLLPRNFTLLTLGFIPALLAGLTLRIMFTDVESAPLAYWFRELFGAQGSAVVAGALTVLTLTLLVLIPLFGTNQTTSKKTGSAIPNTPRPEPIRRTEPSRVDTNRSENGPRQEEAVVASFREGVSGLLQSKSPVRPVYPDLDDIPPQDPMAEIEPDAERKTSSRRTIPPLVEIPPSPMGAPASGFYRTHDGADLEVYFSKDGFISDYPPRIKNKWETVVDETPDGDDNEAAEPPVTVTALDHPAMEPIRSVQEDWVSALDHAATEAAAEEHIEESAQVAVPPASVFPLPPMVPINQSTLGVKDTDEAEDSEIDLIAKEDIGLADEDGDDYVASEDEESDMEQEGAELDSGEGETADVDTRLLPPMPVHVSTSPGTYQVPIKGLLEEPENHEYWLIDEATTRSAHVLKMTLQEFGIQAEVTGIRKGPVITMFEILPAPGVKLAKIVNLADNIALRLAAQTVRIVAPIPGKHAVGIEIPNRERSKVAFAELLAAENFTSSKMEIPVALGKDITGDAQIIDLTKTPHLLIAGSTGSGKSVCVNALISSILYRRSPAEVNLILIDPKIVELKFYNDIPHLLTPVITDPKKAFQALQWCLYEMERRYSLLDAMQVRDIKSYNKKVKSRNIATPHMPYLVVIIDEFADLMATSGKELEGTLARLAAMSRAVGIHLVLATQRPSTDVITGLIKANIPSRIAFMVASKIDSRIILDSMGAEKLLGKGDMLFTSAWDPFPTRMQGAFLSDEEVERVVSHVKTLGKPDYIDDEIFFDSEDNEGAEGDDDFDGSEDPLMRSAIEIVVTAKKASASYLQRRLKIGYNRAARLVEKMEDIGVVGPAQGSKPREILRMFQ